VSIDSGCGPIALVGSGEFLPQMIDIDRVLLDGRVPRAAILATAAGQEGDASINRWLSLGSQHYASIDVEPIPVNVITRSDANNPALAALIDNVGLVYLSGGNPGYLANTLRDTLVWAAIQRVWRDGAALAGCSAGAMALSTSAPEEVRGRSMALVPGLGLVDHLSVIPHFDQMSRWDPQFLAKAKNYSSPGVTMVGIDEDTALVGGLHDWTVMGRLGVTVFGPDGASVHGEGATLSLRGDHP
jgi:cyanophycinase